MEIDAKNLKVLVCSVNAWNSKIGDNTFPSLLRGHSIENVANIFIREDNPDSPVCKKYFRISEMLVVKSIIKRSVKTGKKITDYCIENDSNKDAEFLQKQENIYRNKKKFYYSKLFAREVAWKIGKWHTDELDQFIDEFKPDVVLYEMSRYIHMNRIVRYVLEKTGAVGVGCFWDDTFTYKQENSLRYKILRFFQRKSLLGLAKKTKGFFAITEKTKTEADEFFKIDCTVLTKPVIIKKDRTLPKCEQPLKMLYTGNLNIGREKTILAIIDELEKINQEDVKIRLDIYTKTCLEKEYVQRCNTKFSQLHEAVSQEKVVELQNQTDVLLFVESFDIRNQIARLSFSTKITDYYAAGKCIIAVGNANLAPIEVFSDDESAIIATNQTEIAFCLKKLLNSATVMEYADKAYNVGLEKYSIERVNHIFYSQLIKTYSSKMNCIQGD